MSGSFVSQDGKTHSHAGWHMTPHTRSQTRQAEKCARFTGYAVDPVPAGAQDALRGRKQLAAQPYLPQNVRAPSAASATHASKRSRQHAAPSSSARDCSARRRYPAQARRTYAIWPELRPQDRRVDRNFFFVYGDRRDDVYGKSLPAWTERRVRTRRSGAKPSGISCHYSCTITCCREAQGRAVI